MIYLDEVSAAYVCMWGMAQKDNDIAKSEETSRMECAKACNSNEECVGFDYNPTTKDCFLSKMSWRHVAPRSLSNWWVCEKKDGKSFPLVCP